MSNYAYRCFEICDISRFFFSSRFTKLYLAHVVSLMWSTPSVNYVSIVQPDGELVKNRTYSCSFSWTNEDLYCVRQIHVGFTYILVICRPVSHTLNKSFITFTYEKWNSWTFSYFFSLSSMKNEFVLQGRDKYEIARIMLCCYTQGWVETYHAACSNWL
jgi:hypothetical protein